jgi:threonylcarbamoyladenosine tRNA methylthiotransferase MtaB
MAVIRRARDLRPGIAIGADLIAGFPTETDALFQETLDFVRETALPYLHVFPYSERTGTPASRMPAVPMHVRKERAAALRRAGAAESLAFFTDTVGRVVSLLTETDQFGHSDHFVPVRLSHPAAPGRLMQARVTSVAADAVVAEAA